MARDEGIMKKMFLQKIHPRLKKYIQNYGEKSSC